MRIYIGNLSRDISEDEVKQEFAAFGAVDSVALIKDKFSGELKGFGFVELPVQAEGEAAIAGLNGKEIKGRKVTVNEARPMTENRAGGGGGSRGGFGGGNRRSGGSGGNSGGGGRRSW
jgi:RNA recognition motif-containing protein